MIEHHGRGSDRRIAVLHGDRQFDPLKRLVQYDKSSGRSPEDRSRGPRESRYNAEIGYQYPFVGAPATCLGREARSGEKNQAKNDP
jgi:hypothetical protein